MELRCGQTVRFNVPSDIDVPPVDEKTYTGVITQVGDDGWLSVEVKVDWKKKREMNVYTGWVQCIQKTPPGNA